MERNRNGYWMSPKFQFLSMCPGESDPGSVGGAGGGTGAPAGGDNGGAGDNNGGAGGDDNKGDAGKGDDLAAQLEQLKAELAKQKTALDKATHEAADNKRALGEAQKQLKAKMTQEEIDAANKKEAEEKAAQELENLRKEVAKAKNTKSVMGKLSVDEDTAGKIAESLTGCENIDNALLLIQQAWTAKEKALRMEFGKIPGPGAGGSSEEDAEEKAAIEKAKQLGKERSEINKSVTDALKGYMR